jgi:hypothetical protein
MMRPLTVEVAEVVSLVNEEVALVLKALIAPTLARPETAKSVPGVVVPTPTLPLESMMKAEVVERPALVVATLKSGRLEATEPVEDAWMVKRPQGVVVPRAMDEVEKSEPIVVCPSVDEAMRACGNARSDEVDCASDPQAVEGVNGYETLPGA